MCYVCCKVVHEEGNEMKMMLICSGYCKVMDEFLVGQRNAEVIGAVLLMLLKELVQS